MIYKKEPEEKTGKDVQVQIDNTFVQKYLE